jgi:hypothetical protein
MICLCNLGQEKEKLKRKRRKFRKIGYNENYISFFVQREGRMVTQPKYNT